MFRLSRVLIVMAVLALALAACAPAPAPAPQPTQPPAKAPEATKAPAPAPTKAPEPAKVGGEFHGAFPYAVPPTGHLNSFTTNGIPNGISIYWDLLELPGARYYWAENKWMPLAAEKWAFQPPDKFVLTLRKGIKWSDGKDFTAKDVVATYNVGRLFKWTEFKYVDTVKALDDYTVEFHMATPSTVIERYVLISRYRSAATYGAIADEVQKLVDAKKGADTDEWKALVQKATEFRPKELIVNGPFNLDMASITEAQLTLVKNPKSYLADKVGFDKIVLYNGETPVVTPLVLAGDVDYATHGFPTATEKQYIDMGIRILRAPVYSGPAIYFNQDIYPFSKPEFRQAIAYAVNRDENGKVSLGQSGKAVVNMAGFSDILVPNWLTKEQMDKLNKYAYDPKKGEEILTKIGFKKGSEGIWLDDQGKKLEFELSVPAEFADWSAAAENLAEQLNKFGVKTTVRGVNFQQHPTDVNQGKFQMAIRAWGSANPHPHFSFVQDLFTHNYIGSTVGKGMNFPMKQTVDGKEVDLEKVVVQAAEGLDVNAQKEKIFAAASVFNQLLPIVPLWERYGNNPLLAKRITGVPDDANPIFKNAVYGDNFMVMMILDGTLKPK
jgi:peptide/nickel transport system substrate-binding protein